MSVTTGHGVEMPPVRHACTDGRFEKSLDWIINLENSA